MKILISGASGLIGSALCPTLDADGHEIWRLVRGSADGAREIVWDPAAETIDREAIAAAGIDAVIHLAGESIMGRWTASKKKRIERSRVQGTGLLARVCGELERAPKVMVSASAIGYYGDRGDQLLDEDSPPGDGFLAQVCQRWEGAAEPARRAGIRVVHPRFGAVLTTAGGALAQMLTPFRLGLGGVVGSGEQWFSWIALDDVVGALTHLLSADELSGAYNAVAPAPLRNRAFTRLLGEALHRPTVLPLPAFAARLAFGEVADELLLASARVDASRLVASGYRFRWPALGPLLEHLLDE